MTLFDYSSLAPGAKRVIVVGCGRLGSVLAGELAEAGHRVRVIDQNRAALDTLPPGPVSDGVITPVLGDGTSEADLLRASIRDVDLFIAATGSDSTNALAAQMAQYLFDVQTAVCRIDEPSRKALYEGLGLVAISATGLASEAIMTATRGE
jgi:trk system potassium uptake protein